MSVIKSDYCGIFRAKEVNLAIRGQIKVNSVISSSKTVGEPIFPVKARTFVANVPHSTTLSPNIEANFFHPPPPPPPPPPSSPRGQNSIVAAAIEFPVPKPLIDIVNSSANSLSSPQAYHHTAGATSTVDGLVDSQILVSGNCRHGFLRVRRGSIWVDRISSLQKSKFWVSFPPTIVLGVSPLPTKKKVKQNLGFGVRNQGHRVLANASITTDVEFQPSFEDYLKAMESVKSSRLEKTQQTHTKRHDKPNNATSSTSSRVDIPTVEGSNGNRIDTKGRTYRQSEVEKKKGFEDEGNADRARSRPGRYTPEVNGSMEGSNGNRSDTKERTYRQWEVEKKKGFEDKGNADRARSRPGRYTSVVNGSMDDAQNYKKTEVGYKDDRWERQGGSGLREKQTDKGRWERQLTGGVREKQTDDETREHGLKMYRGDLRVKQITTRNANLRQAVKPITEKNEQAHFERAAFRRLEEFDDVVDKPRLTRREMEERVQKLARCLNGADIDMPEWMFSKMMRSARIKFADYSIMRIIQVLGKLGNWRRVLQLVEWLQLHDRYKSHKLRHIFTAALNVLGKARRPVEALNLFYVMQQHMESYPDLVSYHCMAVTLGQAGHIKELFEVIDIMRSPPKKNFKTGVLEKWDPRLQPDIVVYNAVLNACVRRSQWEGAFWVLQQFKEHGQKPSSTTYGLVMEVMYACGKYQLVHDFFKKILKSSIPSTLTYKVLVNTLWKEGRTDEAVLAVEDMERRGIVGSAALYYDLARCLCSAGRCHEGLLQIEKSCEVANKPLVVTYTGLIQACLDAGSIQNGVYIFNHMQKFCAPNLVTYNIMLKAYLDHKMFEDAKGLFVKMLEDSRDRVFPDIYTFNAMLDACVMEQRWEDLAFVYKQMLHHGYHFNAKRHLSMIMNAFRAGKKEVLEMTWLHLEQTGQTPPPLLAKEMFCLKLEQGDCAGALTCVTSHHYSGGDLQQFTEKAWLNCFKENAHRLQKDVIGRLVHQGNIHMSGSGSQPQILQNLVTSCTVFLMTHTTTSESIRVEHS